MAGGTLFLLATNPYPDPNLAFTRYCFTIKHYCGSPSSLYCPTQLQSIPYCNTIARPLRNIHPPPRPPLCLLYTIQYW